MHYGLSNTEDEPNPAAISMMMACQLSDRGENEIADSYLGYVCQHAPPPAPPAAPAPAQLAALALAPAAAAAPPVTIAALAV